MQMSDIYKFGSIRAYNATFMRTRILLGQDDTAAWDLYDRRCSGLLVQKTCPNEKGSKKAKSIERHPQEIFTIQNETKAPTKVELCLSLSRLEVRSRPTLISPSHQVLRLVCQKRNPVSNTTYVMTTHTPPFDPLP